MDRESQDPTFGNEGNRPRKKPAYFSFGNIEKISCLKESLSGQGEHASPSMTVKFISGERRKKRLTKAPAHLNAYVTSDCEDGIDSSVSMTQAGTAWMANENGSKWNRIAEYLPSSSESAFRKRFSVFYLDHEDAGEKTASDKTPTPAQRKVASSMDELKNEPSYDNQGERPRKAPEVLSFGHAAEKSRSFVKSSSKSGEQTSTDITNQRRKKRPRKAPSESFSDDAVDHAKRSRPYKGSWTSKEDNWLREKRALGSLSWDQIASFFPGRTKESCRQRFNRYLMDPSGTWKEKVAVPNLKAPPKGENRNVRKKKDILKIPFEKRILVNNEKPRWTEEDLDLALHFFRGKRYVGAFRAKKR